MHFPVLISLGLLPLVLAKVQFLGVAIAGGDFGCQIDGTCPSGSVQLPLHDGPKQMSHFVKDDGINLLRLPTSWQFLVNNKLGGDFDTTNVSKYDQLLQACLDAGAHCMIDIHNFARWNGKIIGQGGPTDEQFASFWGQLADRYADKDRVIFELMNEPHDLDVAIWAETCQKAVTAIREAGASSQMILLPGTDFDSAATLVSSESADALMAITNPDGSTDNLVLDIHKYLDKDNSGTHAECTTDNVEALATVADYLREKGRKGLISETGASDDATCFASFCVQNEFINTNSDVFLGLVAWGAGSFSTDYILGLTPSDKSGQLVDTELMKQCLLDPWNNSTNSGENSNDFSNNNDNSSNAVPTTTSRRSSGIKDSPQRATFGTGVLILSTALLPTPTALATDAPITTATPAFSSRSGSPTVSRNGSVVVSGDSPNIINTSGTLLILTDIIPQEASTLTTLAIATEAPPTGSGIDGLLTAASDDGPLPTAPALPGSGNRPSAAPSSSPSPSHSGKGGGGEDGDGNNAAGLGASVGRFTLWGCVLGTGVLIGL